MCFVFNLKKKINAHTKKRIINKYSENEEFLYEIMLNHGASLNDSIRKDERISPLGFAFSKGGDSALIKDLIKRGCKLNTSEVAQLAHYYVEYAMLDSKKKLNEKSYYKSRHENREVLREANNQGLQQLNLFSIASVPSLALGGRFGSNDRADTPSHQRDSEGSENSGHDSSTDNEQHFFGHNMDERNEYEDQTTHLETLYHVTLSCGLHLSWYVF